MRRKILFVVSTLFLIIISYGLSVQISQDHVLSPSKKAQLFLERFHLKNDFKVLEKFGFNYNEMARRILHLRSQMEFVLIERGAVIQKLQLNRLPTMIPPPYEKLKFWDRPLLVSQPFYISRTLMPNRAWALVMGKKLFYPGRDSKILYSGMHPCTDLSWKQLEFFLKKTGFSLPTEAQWELAQRTGVSTHSWWGNSLPQKARMRVEGCEKSWFGYEFHFSVGLRLFKKNQPNYLLDSPSTVMELCKDSWRSTQEIIAHQKTLLGKVEVDPFFHDNGDEFVVRGFGGDEMFQFRRMPLEKSHVSVYGVGFRFVKNLKFEK